MTKSRGILAPRQHWSEAELALLASMYPDCHTADVAEWVGHTLKATYQRALAIGLRKSAEYLASDTACRIQQGKQNANMIASRFQAGQAAWNKGVKGSTGLHENCRRTQFKKGQMHGAAQHNYVPVGSLRISKDGYLERKQTDDHPVPTRRWEAVHRIVWRAAHGPIPAGHIVCFKPGKKTVVLDEITVDRLECITRAENAHRNHPRNRDPELGRLIQLKGAITRQVNRIAREAQEKTA
jgi:hypothetical protein